MTKCLVTGCAGFIGSNLCDYLIANGYSVKGIDNLSTGFLKNVNPKVEFLKADIREYNLIEHYFSDVDTVFHLAALARIQPSIENPIESHSVNVDGTLNVLEASRHSGVKKFIFAGSSSIYDDPAPGEFQREDSALNPKSPYSVQKLIGEKYCQLYASLYGLDTIRLRFFNVYGRRQLLEGAYAAVIGIFLEQRKQGKPLTVFGGSQRRDFTNVSDVVKAILKAATTNIQGEKVFNVGTGHNYSIIEVAEMVGGEILVGASNPGEARETLASIERTKRLLDWKPEIQLDKQVIEQMAAEL